MTLSINDFRKKICDAVVQNIEKEYNELLRLNDFPKDHMWINQFWIRFVKDIEIQVTRHGPGIETSITPIYKFVPEPTNRIVYNDIKFPSAIFDIRSIGSFLHELDPATKSKIMTYLPELIVTCLESSQQEIPPMTEVKKNLNMNIQGFLARIEEKDEKLRSIAPINGIEWKDTVFDNSVRFSETTLRDLQDIEMIKHNKRDPAYFDYFYDFTSPVVAVEFDFDWNPNPNDYSVVQNVERLHQTAMRKFDTILSVCRLAVENPDWVGIGLIFHLNSNWTTYMSTKMITEDPSPNFKPILTDGTPIRRDESYFPAQKIHVKDLQDLLTRVTKIRDLASNQSIDDNTHLELLYAFELYSKYVDEHNIDWKLLI